MSVMAETSQLAIRLYTLLAASGLVLYACTAVCSEALVVKIPGGVAPIIAGIHHGA